MLVGRVGLAALSILLGAHYSDLNRNHAGKALANFVPSPQEVRDAYARADGLTELVRGKTFKLRVLPHWYDKDRHFWYRNDLQGGTKEFMIVETARGNRYP